MSSVRKVHLVRGKLFFYHWRGTRTNYVTLCILGRYVNIWPLSFVQTLKRWIAR